MRMTSDSSPGINLVRSFKNGTLLINATEVRSSVCVSGQVLLLLPDLSDAAALTDAHANTILGTNPEVVLLGTGERHVFPSTQWSAQFLTRSVGIEVMTTAAACRTYNVLASEHRRVTALLIIG